MIEIKKKNTSFENMQEEIRIFKKNEQSIYDLLALYQYISEKQEEDQNINDIIGVTLLDKVISNFEDPEVNVRYRFRNINEIINTINNYFYEIFKKYNCYECLDLKNNFNISYKENTIHKSLISQNKSKDIDLIQLLVSKTATDSLINDFLASNIPFDVRLEMFSDMLACKEANIPWILSSNSSLGRANSNKVIEKKKELIQAFNDGKCKSYDIASLFYRLLGENHIDTINYLQDNYFDFNQIYVDIPTSVSMKISKISAVVLLTYETQSTKKIEKLYESKNYLRLDKEVRENNDLYILNGLKTTDDLCQFITLSNFEVTEEKIKILAKRYIDFQKEMGFSYYKYSRNRVKNIIIRKAKNKTEYKKYLEYADIFMEDSDYNQFLQNEAQEQERLNNARNELLIRLYNMNDSLQEQVPGKTHIKDLKFRKSNSIK